ncbi:MAG: sugar phosphate isomerase/epimerase family protein, partial [Bullifex sp.]
MKLGFLSAILDGWTYEEMMNVARDMGFKCVEVACWPQGKAERRYAGVSHIDAERVLEDDEYANHILSYASECGVEISSLGYYPNPLDSDEAKREAAVSHLKALVKASAKLGVNMVTTFIGRDQRLTVDENLKLVSEVWPPIITLEEELGV